MNVRKIKYIMLIFLISTFSQICNANYMNIDCWSGQKEIYKGKGYHVMYGDGFIVFNDSLTKDTIYVNGDCVVSFKK